MRKVLFGLFILFPVLVWAQDPASNTQATQLPTDSPSFSQVTLPPIPQFDWEGNSIKAEPSTSLPQSERVEALSINAADLIQISDQENLPNHLYWHQGDQGPYCHYVDFQGDDWFGWQEDAKFQWVFAYQGTLWAQEPMDGRWLCYSKSNWWFKGDDAKNQWSLYRDGTYYFCDVNGKITDAKGERPGELKSDYDGPFQGDSMSQQVFVPASHASHGSGHPGGHGHGGGQPGGVPLTQSMAWNGH